MESRVYPQESRVLQSAQKSAGAVDREDKGVSFQFPEVRVELPGKGPAFGETSNQGLLVAG